MKATTAQAAIAAAASAAYSMPCNTRPILCTAGISRTASYCTFMLSAPANALMHPVLLLLLLLLLLLHRTINNCLAIFVQRKCQLPQVWASTTTPAPHGLNFAAHPRT
jgi:hypothetical protein